MKGARTNPIEQLKAEKNGLDVRQDIPRFAEQGYEAIPAGDKIGRAHV